jgi:Kelch motif
VIRKTALLAICFALIATGAAFAASGGPNAAGYSWDDDAYTYSWEDATAGALVNLDDDEVGGPYPIGFTFNFYGTAYTEFYISSNGWITFSATADSDFSEDCPIDAVESPKEMIALMWEDLDPETRTDAIYYETFGTAGSRYTVIQYDDVCFLPCLPTNTAFTAQIILFEGTDEIVLQYQDPSVLAGTTVTVGINDDGSDPLTVNCLDTFLFDDYAILIGKLDGVFIVGETTGIEKPGVDLTYSVEVTNLTGSNGTATVSVTGNSWATECPASVSVDDGDTETIECVVTIDAAADFHDTDTATIEVSLNGFSDEIAITTEAIALFAVGPPLPEALSRPAGAYFDGKFYVTGGQETVSASNSELYIYDVTAESWSTSPSDMPHAVQNQCATVYDGAVYVVGGIDGTTGVGTDEVQVYDIAGDTWSQGTPLPEYRYYASCATIGDKIYVVGGQSDAALTTDTLFIYDAIGDTWSNGAALPYTANVTGMMALDGMLYVAGGLNYDTFLELDKFTSYDPSADTWTSLEPLSFARGGLGLGYAGDAIWIFGGGFESFRQSVEKYDPTAKAAWIDGGDGLNVGRRTFAYGSGDDHLFAAAGWNGGFLDDFETLFLDDDDDDDDDTTADDDDDTIDDDDDTVDDDDDDTVNDDDDDDDDNNDDDGGCCG